jgi:hypothetical protein
LKHSRPNFGPRSPVCGFFPRATIRRGEAANFGRKSVSCASGGARFLTLILTTARIHHWKGSSSSLFLRGYLCSDRHPRRCRLEMIMAVGSPCDTPASCANTNRQVNIIVSNGELLVETSDLVEYCAADYHTGCGNAGYVLFETSATKIRYWPEPATHPIKSGH